MRNYFLRGYIPVLFGILSFTMISCNNDDDVVVDTTDPTITITSPTQAQIDAGFAAGSSMTLTGTVTDNDIVHRVVIRLTNAAGLVLLNEEMNDVNQQSVTINETVQIPDQTPAGSYTVTITAMDRTGNESTYTSTFNITVEEVALVTFIVTTPESTPEDADVHIVGQFNDWDPGDTNFRLTPVEDEENMYTISMDWTEGTPYKFVLGAWDFVEKDENCEEIEDRQFTPSTEPQEIEVTIENWRNQGDCPD
ncbi:MAG: DUF4625 domain-containing protein [Bacteroidota bacterium]|nr:DUF4625 domain-containing protein [Bacteroidota bacterium]